MNWPHPHTVVRFHANGATRRAAAFSLVELLTVVFIISLLIAILVPSLNSARNSAKNTSTKAAFNSIKVALDMFKNDHEKRFRQTNGYPPSFAHPRMVNEGTNTAIFEGWKGEFPFIEGNKVVSGAQWLPAMLMGVDQQGYISRSSVPKRDGLRDEPWRWYTPDPLGDGTNIERSALYLDPGSINTTPTKSLLGSPNADLADWFDFSITDSGLFQALPVIVDAFGQPILYYAANKSGRSKNMVEIKREENNTYTGGVQKSGPPYYFHQDNLQFTGDKEQIGWDFGDGEHAIAVPGDELTADQLIEGKYRDTFARFILDRSEYRKLQNIELRGETIDPKMPLKPVNPDSYILISAGVDTIFGTNDDVVNFITDLEE